MSGSGWSKKLRWWSVAASPESVKERAGKGELARAKQILGEQEIQRVEAIEDDRVDEELAHELGLMKRSDPSGYRALVASLPRENREMIARVEREFDF